MKPHRIISLETRDVRFPLHEGAGSDAVHSGSAYAFATTLLASGDGLYGTGIVLTLGQGNQLVCEAIQLLASGLVRTEISHQFFNFRAEQTACEKLNRFPHQLVALAKGQHNSSTIKPVAAG